VGEGGEGESGEGGRAYHLQLTQLPHEGANSVELFQEVARLRRQHQRDKEEIEALRKQHGEIMEALRHKESSQFLTDEALSETAIVSNKDAFGSKDNQDQANALCPHTAMTSFEIPMEMARWIASIFPYCKFDWIRVHGLHLLTGEFSIPFFRRQRWFCGANS
jgi:hypothetical protein